MGPFEGLILLVLGACCWLRRRGASPVTDAVRRELTAYLLDTDASANPVASGRSNYHEAQGRAVQAARQAVLAMRDSDEIGDDAFHRIEEELDWLEMAGQSLDR